MRILLVEDEEKLAAYVKAGLEQNGHIVDRSGDGQNGLFYAVVYKTTSYYYYSRCFNIIAN
ncbi:MAG: hypothetical protein KAT71_00185 [Gammaproteobacteria bacterium]|nr:hypothetical protein [Gammaproteobacteria bacterium]